MISNIATVYAYLMMNSMSQLEFWMAARESLDEVF